MSTDALHEGDSLSSSEARKNWRDVVGAAEHAGRITRITYGRSRKIVAAVVSAAFLEEALAAMERVEDEELGRIAAAAIEADRGQPVVSSADVRSRLGL